MLIGEIISVALGALRANKLRSMLTMLGIVIGVGAVIAVVALGTGAQQAIKDRISSLGTTLLTVNPGQQRGGGGGIAIQGGQQRLTIDDAKAIDERAMNLLAVQPEMRSQQQVVYGNKNASTTIVGTTPNYLEVRKYQIKVGKMFTAGEAVRGNDRGGGFAFPYPLNRHQSNGFQRLVIKPATVSFHPEPIPGQPAISNMVVAQVTGR